jgi:hypothetical protein
VQLIASKYGIGSIGLRSSDDDPDRHTGDDSVRRHCRSRCDVSSEISQTDNRPVPTLEYSSTQASLDRTICREISNYLLEAVPIPRR